MRIRPLITFFLFAFLPLTLAAQDETSSVRGSSIPTASIELRVFDRSGALLPEVRIESFTDSKGKDYSSNFETGGGRIYAIAKGMPLGRYQIKISLDQFRSAQREVGVFQVETLIVMALEQSGSYGCCYHRITGRVVGDRVPNGRRGFVKITGTMADYARESSINPDGTFALDDVHEGKNLIMVVDQDVVSGLAIVDVPKDSFVEIHLRTDPFALEANR